MYFFGGLMLYITSGYIVFVACPDVLLGFITCLAYFAQGVCVHLTISLVQRGYGGQVS